MDEIEDYHELWACSFIKYCPDRMLVKVKCFLVHAMVKGKVARVHAM
jgi:hypothetical protein